MAGLRKFVHVRQDGNQIFYKGHKLEFDSDTPNLVLISRNGGDYENSIVAAVCLAPSESVGEYFAPDKDKE